MKDIWIEIKVAAGILAIFLATVALCIAVSGCSTESGDVRYNLELAQHVDPRFNWSQEALKRHDYGCPGAIFVAPDGVLEQCQ